MIVTSIKNRFSLLALVLGLGILALAACGSDAATSSAATSSAGQAGSPVDLADLSDGQIGASSLQRIIEATLGTQASNSTGIWVTGRGQASAEPDVATLNLGVESFAGTVAEARDNAASQMGRVIEVLKAKAIADRDIQTRSFNINARYTTREVTRCTTSGEVEGTEQELESSFEVVTVTPTPEVEPALEIPSAVHIEPIDIEQPRLGQECLLERERVIVGYTVTNQLSVQVRDLDSVGGIIDEVTEAGGDLIRFQGISFTIEDTEELQDQARAAAVADLNKKATRIADLAGVELGRLVFITETSSPMVTPQAVAERVVFAASAAPTPILAGELDVVVTVQAVFDIRQPAG